MVWIVLIGFLGSVGLLMSASYNIGADKMCTDSGGVSFKNSDGFVCLNMSEVSACVDDKGIRSNDKGLGFKINFSMEDK